jgi:hypothetical protein
LGHLLKPDWHQSQRDLARHDRIFSRLAASQAEAAVQEGSMRRLPFLFIAAAIAIWGLASIPDGSNGEKSLQVSAVRTAAAAHRHGQSAATPHDALSTQKATPSSPRAGLIVVGLGPE